MNTDRDALLKIQDDLTKAQNTLINIQWVLTFIPASWVFLLTLYRMVADPISVDGQILFVSDPKAFDCYSLLEFLLVATPIVILSIIVGLAVICFQLAAFKIHNKKPLFPAALFIIFSAKFIWLAFFGGVLEWILD